MARGRRAASAADEKARGYPGKRKSKTDRQLEQAAALAEQLAAAPAASGEAMAAPVFLDARSAPALRIWRDLAPTLVATGRLTEEDRFIFAQFCVYAGEWVAANEEVLAKGYSQRVATVAGGYMERTRPAVAIRERALDVVLKLAEKFGLTPRDRYSLFKEQAGAGLGGLFGQTPPRGDGDEAPAEPPPASEDDPIGMLGRLNSAPPPRPN
ncbi:MAG: P27 family phage terminase small subunit [Brevundimonas sp.]|uniref:P27 family phage terminase small subunit n=1 Tax=Brevundimonas sp. TaxID=1871086 RepID=UPI0040345CD0